MKRKNKIFYTTVSVFLMSTILCSCSGYTEIENMDILTSHFVYKDGNEIRLGGGIANVRSFSDSMADRPISYISAVGTDVGDASKRLRFSADHKLFYGGIRALVIGEEYAKSGIGEFLDYVQALPDHRTSVSVFTSSTEPRDIVEYKAVNDFSGGFAAESIVRTLQNDKAMITCTLSDIWEANAQNKVGFVVPDIKIVDNIMSIDGYSVFDGDKKIAHIDALYGRGLNYIISKNAKENYVVKLPSGSEYYAEVNMKKKKINMTENEQNTLMLNGEFVFDLTINTRGVGELDEEQKAYIKNTIAEKILYEIDSVLNIAKENKCDFLRLYKVYQSKKRNRFYEIDWQEMIGTMNISTNVLIDKIKNDTVR